MRLVFAVVSAVSDSVAPDGTMTRLRMRSTLDLIITLIVTVLAVGLTVGYQVLGRWARRSGDSD